MRERETKGQERIRRRSSKTGTETDIATIPSVVEKANAFSAGNNKACSDGGSRTNKCSDGEGTRTKDGDISQERLLCYRGEQGEKLLCLRGI